MSLWLSGERVPQGVELVAILVNHTGVDAMFGVAAGVDRWNGSEWVPYRKLEMCLDHWHCTGEMHSLDGELAVEGIGLGAGVGSPGPVERFTTVGLTPGWYRVTQVANEKIAAAGVFEVTEEGSTPAPLVPLDAAAISVYPGLIPAGADGTEVVLTPLIPAFGGAQSITDVEQAVDGLAETATIERWDGSRWTRVDAVDLRIAEPVADLERVAELPPLPEGEYRLVRAGPGDPHRGRFWVTATAA